MGGEVCFNKIGKRGPWYEVKTLMETKSCSNDFKVRLLKSWKKYPGYQKYAKDALETLAALVANQNPGGLLKKKVVNHSPRIMKQQKQGVLI